MSSVTPLSTPTAFSTLKARGQKTAAEEASDQAFQAEQDANRRIAGAEQAVEEAQRDAGAQIDAIRDEYSKRAEDQYTRNEEVLEKQKLKGYEELRELQRAQAAELSRVRHEGDQNLSKLQNYYHDNLYSTEHTGDEKLRALEAQQARELNYAQQTKTEDVNLAKDNYHRQFEEVRQGNEENLQKFKDSSREDYERIRANSVEANQKANESFQQKYDARVKESDDVLLNLNNRASEAIREVRRDTSEKLAAYSSRQRDPFYRMKDLDARLSEESDAYVLTASIPEHEQKHVSVAVKGGQLVLQGYRNNEEKLELEPGHTQGTNTYQSFLETFPIIWPVDANRMTRQFEGDQLTVRIPKKNENPYRSEAQAKVPVQRARLERPKFPENLPQTASETASKKGSGTLS